MSGRAAFGTTVEYTPDGGPKVLIGGLTDIGGVSMSADQQEVTSHDSTGGFKEYIPTLLEPGEITMEMNMLPADAGQVAVQEHFTARENRAITVTYPDGDNNAAGSTWEFDASVSKFETGKAPVNGILGASITFRISGQPVFTPVGGS